MKNNNNFRHILTLELHNLKQTIFLDKNTYSIGRNSTNSIVVHHRVLSRTHATLLKVTYRQTGKDHDVFWVIDGDLKGNRSTNGIYVNGNRCLSHKLKPGDLILFGGLEVKGKYDIVDPNSQKFLSLLKEEQQVNEVSTEKANSEQENNKSTFIGWDQDKQEPLTEEFITKINSVQELFSVPIIELNLEGEIIAINPAAEREFPLIKELKLEHPIVQNLPKNFQENQLNLLAREITINGDNFTQYAYLSTENKLIKTYLLDLKNLQQLHLLLKEGEQLYDSLVKQISEGIFLVDPVSQKILDANPAYCDLLGYSLEEILELNIYDLVAIERDILERELQQISKEKIAFIRESIHRRKNNTFVNVEVSVSFIFYQAKEVICFVVRDISERKKSEELLRYQAFHDSLTNLPNQKLFYEQLKSTLHNARNTKQVIALMFIKLDGFKKINYSLGHSRGDKLLQKLVKRIKSCLRPMDVLARWGGDEFTVLLPDIENADNVANISQAILEIMKEPFIIEDYQLNVNMNLGIALSPQHGKNSTTLLKNADAALYHLEKRGGNKYQFFSPTMSEKVEENIKLESLLNRAIINEKLEVFYQPEINLKTEEIVEFEAWVKWPNSELGEIPAEQFIPIAEDTGLIVPLNYWMIKTACRQNQIWQKNKLPHVKVKIKLYSRCLQDPNFLSQITDILAETKLEPNFLDLQIQETNIIQNSQSSRRKLRDLQKMGVTISLDDFASGNSSLNCLTNFPFNKLQIASSLIENLNQEPKNLAIISTITTLASSFNMQVVAKGVNSMTKMELLINLQCDRMQGELFSPFLNAEKATNLLSGKNNTLTKIINQKKFFKMFNYQ